MCAEWMWLFDSRLLFQTRVVVYGAWSRKMRAQFDDSYSISGTVYPTFSICKYNIILHRMSSCVCKNSGAYLMKKKKKIICWFKNTLPIWETLTLHVYLYVFANKSIAMEKRLWTWYQECFDLEDCSSVFTRLLCLQSIFNWICFFQHSTVEINDNNWLDLHV